VFLIDPNFRAQWVMVVSWLIYLVVCEFHMIGLSSVEAAVVVAIQVGY
jgi:hypothetical protein